MMRHCESAQPGQWLENRMTATGQGVWHAALPLEEVPPGEARQVVIEGRAVAVYNVGGDIFATADTCTHAQASLSQGYLEGCEIECPLHGGRFDIRSGAAIERPARVPVRSLATRVEAGMILVEVEAET
jgi:naphthalene 1,2-dioxygenase system ferredoxin subunit